jgi:hypothetical protein
MQEEKASKQENKRSNRVAIFFIAFMGIVCFISALLLMLGGPK